MVFNRKSYMHEYNKTYDQTHRAEKALRNKKYREKHREELNKKQREYAKKHYHGRTYTLEQKQRIKQYQIDHKERIKFLKHQNYINHKHKTLAKHIKQLFKKWLK